MFQIQTKSPTRVDLAGGTLDCWPLYLFLGQPVTINVAIDIFTYVDLKERHDLHVELTSVDLNINKVYSNLSECLSDKEQAFDLVRAHLAFWRPSCGFSLTTRSESPVGGGLGGSSSLCISLLKAFSAWVGEKIEPHEMVRIASHLEAQILQKPTGTQDYFPPLYGGLNEIIYGVRGPRVQVHRLATGLFDGRFLLVYTGRSHHSGINNWQVIKNWLDGDVSTQQSLFKLAEVAKEMRQTLLGDSTTVIGAELRGPLSKEVGFTGHSVDQGELMRLFAREFKARCELSDGFTSPEIKRLAQMAAESGAQAKICGAGGGGCVLIWCPDGDSQRQRLVSQIQAAGFRVLTAQPWDAAPTRDLET